MAKLLPSSNSAIVKYQKSAVVKSNKFLSTKTTGIKVDAIKQNSNFLLLDIEKKVIQVDKLLKDSLLLSKKDSELKRKSSEKVEFEGREKELEQKKPPLVKGIKLPSLPKMGFLDWIKNFITQTILGFFAVRLIDFLPQLLKILPVIIKVGDFFTDVGGKMLDGLITFVDWGYKAIDGTREFVKQLGGEGLAQNFDKFAGAIDNVIEIAIIAALATADGIGGDRDRGGPGGGRGGGYRNGVRTGQYNGFNTRTSRGGSLLSRTGDALTAQRGDASASSYIKSEKDIMKRYFQRYGRDAFIQRFGEEGLKRLPGGMQRGLLQRGARSAFTGLLGKGGAKTVLKFIRPFTKRLPIIGGLLDFGLSVALGEKIGRAAFRAIGATLLGAVGAAVGGPFALLTGLAGGTLGDIAGGALYDLFFENKKPKGKTVKAAGGGKPATRGGKPVSGPAKRTVTKKKTPRTLKATPSKLKPGGVIGGEKKIKELYPESKDKSKMSPFDFLKNSYNTFAKSSGLGALIALAIKPIMGDKPTYADYKNAGTGVNNWMNQSIASGTLAYAGGGEVKMESIVSGEDYSDVIAKSLQDSVAPQVDKTIQDLMKQLMLKKTEPEIKEKEPTGEPTTPEGIPLDEGSTASGRSLMQGLIQRGFTKEESAAIVGNLWAESGFRTNATNPTSGAFGLMQWLSGRKSRLYSYAAEKGKSVTDVNLQLDYIKWELKGGNAYETEQFKKAMSYGNTVSAKTKGFAEQVERASSGELSRSMSKRIGAAESVYGGKMVAGEKPSSSYSATSGKFKVIEYLTGDRGHPNFELAGHGMPGNYHDHIAFATVEEKERAKSALKSAGIKIGSELRPGDPGYHGRNLAIDIPGYQWGGSGGIGSKEFAGSRKVRSILGIGNNVSRFHGGPILKTGNLFAHKGEYVIDKDSVDLFGMDFVDSINRVENKAQLVARAPSIIEKLKSISGYTDYEQPEPEVVFIPIPTPDSGGTSGGSSKPSLSVDYPTIDTMGEQMSDSLMYG